MLDDEDFSTQGTLGDSEGDPTWLMPKEKLEQWKRNRRALVYYWQLLLSSFLLELYCAPLTNIIFPLLLCQIIRSR